jgi:hypothetical protein
VVLATLLSAGLVLVPTTVAIAVTLPRVLNDTRSVGAHPVYVDFAIEHFGLVADLRAGVESIEPSGRVPYGEARFLVDEGWTAWQALDQDGAQQRGRFTAALLSVDRATAYQVRGLPRAGRSWEAAAINTTDGHSVVVDQSEGGSASASAGCMSRADWGADESLSGWARGDQQTFYPAQALTVHHTAGSNDPNQDYAATVRAIYSYHVQSNGWSDIGYHYLIDGSGKVYEGRSTGSTSTSCLRAGGTGSDFAHQASRDHVITGAHVGGFNSGNVGIALMGCFEPSAVCSGNTTPPSAVDALAPLLGSLARRHGLDPQGTTRYVNPVNGASKVVATISGHRDWEASACPGGTLYEQLPAIRTAAAGTPTPTPTPTPTLTPAPQPAAAITSASCSGSKCSFTGSGVGVLGWRFGNGTTATGPAVSTSYTGAGTFMVTLTDSGSPPTSAQRTVTCQKVKRAVRCST